MNHYAIIADDFTGAGDSGVHFAASGKRTAFVLERAGLAGILAGHEAVSISTESRFLRPEAAAEAVRQTVTACREAGAEVFYKKIDSTLRGNLGAEIEAALQATGCAAAVVCPAMPKTGRTIVEGCLFVNGIPVAETDVGRDPFTPVASSLIAEVVAAQSRLPCSRLPLETIRAGGTRLAKTVASFVETGQRILVADATEDADLATLGELLRTAQDDVRSILPRLLPVGAGGLAEGFVGPARPLDAPLPDGRLLAVIGSLNKTSLEQLEFARKSGKFHSLELDMNHALENPEDEIARLLAEADQSGDRHLLLANRTAPSPASAGIDTDDGIRAADMFARVAREICVRTGSPRLYLTGGSTAVAVAGALGVKTITLEREILPGIAVSSCRSPVAPVRWFITKAGGFGGPDAIVRVAGPDA